MKNTKFPQIVIFDLYGTLVKFGVMHHPFRQLLKWARENGRKVQGSDARQMMTINGDISVLGNVTKQYDVVLMDVQVPIMRIVGEKRFSEKP